MKTNIIKLTLVLTLASLSPTYAADIEAGKAKSVGCAACHGPNGISANPDWPNLAGQKAKYTASQLKAFREGERDNAMMSPMAKPLSDDDIENLAAYYASLSLIDE